MKSQHVPPSLSGDAFHCPHCQTYTHQRWANLYFDNYVDGFLLSRCVKCYEIAIWHDTAMIYPINASVEPPNPDMSEDIQIDYQEAATIAKLSPRGAAALLRLALQKLCKQLGEPGDNINSDIKSLVQRGLPPKVQEALDTVRVVGNESVHPGTIDLRDDSDTVDSLFMLINFIAQKLITEQREVDEIYQKLPQSKRDSIEARDK